MINNAWGGKLDERVKIAAVDWSEDQLMVKLEIDLDNMMKGADFRGTPVSKRGADLMPIPTSSSMWRRSLNMKFLPSRRRAPC